MIEPPYIDEPGDPQALLARIRTGDWLDQQTFPPLAWSVPGLIPEGFGLLVGPPKAGKSWAALGVALAVAAGGRAFGAVPVGPARPVLYLALEDGERRLQDRARTLLVHDPIPSQLHYITRLDANAVSDLIHAWLAEHGSRKPLVLLDTLGKVLPGARTGESTYGRDYRVAGALKALVDSHPGATLVAVHHDRKGAADDFVDAVSGTHGLAGAADFVIVLDRRRQETNATLKVTGRDVIEAEYAMTMSDGTWTLDGRTLTEAARAATTAHVSANLGDRSQQILKHVDAHPDGISPTALAVILGITAKDAGQYLGRLLRSGRINKTGRGLYAPVESVVTVETPDHSPTHSYPSVESGESDFDTHDGFDTHTGTPATPGGTA